MNINIKEQKREVFNVEERKEILGFKKSIKKIK